MKLQIGLSYCPIDSPKYGKYRIALAEAASRLGYEVETIDLYTNPASIEFVDGILFTGGDDVDPARFHKAEEAGVCEVDPARDEREFAFAEIADARKIPIFGICRGMQLLNVHYGGSLITDLVTRGLPSHSKIEGNDRHHSVEIEADTFLSRLVRKKESSVTSAHHQAIDDLAAGLKTSARASDTEEIIEAIEWEEPQKHPYFLAVQWHPERMEYNQSLAGELFENFLNEVAMSKTLRSRM